MARNARIAKELDMFRLNPPPGICAWVVGAEDDGVTRLEASLSPPVGTPYEGGRFSIDIRLSKQVL